MTPTIPGARWWQTGRGVRGLRPANLEAAIADLPKYAASCACGEAKASDDRRALEDWVLEHLATHGQCEEVAVGATAEILADMGLTEQTIGTRRGGHRA